MRCLKEFQATDFHKLGRDYLVITRDRQCLHIDREENILARRVMAADDLFKFKLIYHLAATMTGIKPLTVMRFKPPLNQALACQNCVLQWRNLGRQFSAQAALGMRVLDQSERGETLLFFHREACRRLLAMAPVQTFLKERGLVYGRETVARPEKFIDQCLKEYRQGRSLPVELGLFMGIPLKDVRGFIAGDEVEAAATAGWKIYGCQQPSLVLANLYRRLRRYAMLAFFERSFEEIVERLSRSRLIGRLELLAQ